MIRDDLSRQNDGDPPHDGGLQELQELHARVLFMLGAARMGTWDANLTTDDVTWSEGLPAIFGLDASQLGGAITMDAFMDLVHPDNREAIARKVTRIDSTELKFAVEFRRVWPDGSLHWLESKGYVVRNDVGRAIRAVGVTSDITDRKRADGELAIYRDLVRHLSLGVYIYSLEDAGDPRSLRLVTTNPAASHFTQVPMQTIIGKTIGEAFPALLTTDLPARYANVIHTGESIEVGDVPYTDDRIEPSIFRVTACPVSDTSMAVLFEDVTEQRRLEAALHHTHKMEAIGLLAGGIAHDFNNLLTVIIGYSDALIEALDDSGLRPDVLEIKAAAERAAGLTNQLLAFGRKQILQPRVVSLNALVAEADTLLRRVLGEHIHMSLVLDPELRSVVADPGQIGQVIVNLAVNARDAMGDGGRLTIETANVDLPAAARGMAHAPSGRYAALSISDTGVGMDAATQARVFEPFFTTKANQGTGLGLATVYGIIKQSGGYIWLYSEVGRGTSFRIYLPAIDTLTDGPDVVAATPTSVTGGDETILLVEDEPALRQLAARVLTSRGYRVLHAGHPHEALALMAQHAGHIQLLLTDIVMPEMGGLALACRVQAEHPETRVLYMSGYSGGATIHDGVRGPGTAFLQKPFTPSTLARKVRDVLDTPRES